jgi:hypothetical protein
MAAFLLCGALARAQGQAPVEFPETEITSHRIGLTRAIHTGAPPLHGFSVTLQVIVNPLGQVESTTAIDGPNQFYGEAESIEGERQFKPFEKDGVPVRASFKDGVSIYPLEEWGEDKTPFPEVKDWSTLRITLKRKGCQFEDKDCLSYFVEILGDGSVTFTGGRNFALITGTHRGRIPQSAVIGLVNEFRRADYFSLKDMYEGPWTDSTTFITSVEFDGNRKQVTDYVGLTVGMPEVVKSLEASVTNESGAAKWLKETDETWPSLVAENWDFKAHTEENRKLFASIAARGSSELILNFLAAGAPALDLTDDGKGAVVSIAGRGFADLTGRMLGDRDQLPAPLLFRALRSAAESGDLETVDLLLGKGADVNGNSGDRNDSEYLDTVLMAAARSGNAYVIEEILRYHPDVKKKDRAGRNALEFFVGDRRHKSDIERVISDLVQAGADLSARDAEGKTPIFSACWNAYAVKPLATAGADLNAQDRLGNTPIMSCFDLEAIQAMVDAGADLSVRNSQGLTAAQKARNQGMKEIADLLDSAMKSKIQPQ